MHDTPPPLSNSQPRTDIIECVRSELDRSVRASSESIIPAKNHLSYRHGRQWRSAHASDAETIHEFEAVETSATIPTSSIIDHDLSCISKFLSEFSGNLQGQLWQRIFADIDKHSKGTERSIDAAELSLIEAQLEGLAAVEFGVDDFGRPSIPEMRMGKTAFDKYQEEIAKLSERERAEYEAKTKSIIDEKSRLATENEARRISKFRLP